MTFVMKVYAQGVQTNVMIRTHALMIRAAKQRDATTRTTTEIHAMMASTVLWILAEMAVVMERNAHATMETNALATFALKKLTNANTSVMLWNATMVYSVP